MRWNFGFTPGLLPFLRCLSSLAPVFLYTPHPSLPLHFSPPRSAQRHDGTLHPLLRRLVVSSHPPYLPLACLPPPLWPLVPHNHARTLAPRRWNAPHRTMCYRRSWTPPRCPAPRPPVTLAFASTTMRRYNSTTPTQTGNKRSKSPSTQNSRRMPGMKSPICQMCGKWNQST